MNNFNTIAAYYDSIARLVFGNAIKECQLIFLKEIPANSKILIIGGGTGWIVREVLSKTERATITYVEKSEKMISKTQSLLTNQEISRIEFINKPFEALEQPQSYDVVIINFFLDVFSKNTLVDVIGKIKDQLEHNGILLVSDFRIENTVLSRLWQMPLMWGMHLFFKLVSNIESSALQPIDYHIRQHGFVSVREKLFFGKMIFSSIYKNS